MREGGRRVWAWRGGECGVEYGMGRRRGSLASLTTLWILEALKYLYKLLLGFWGFGVLGGFGFRESRNVKPFSGKQ